MKLYVKAWCPWCIEAVAWLKHRDYAFEVLDVQTDRAAFDRMVKISGQRLTPTLETADGAVLPDFDVRQLEKFLRELKIEPK